MKIKLNELTPMTRQEKYLYALCERLEKLIPQEEVTIAKAENKPKKTTRKKKVE
jgi:hypothetical protein